MYQRYLTIFFLLILPFLSYAQLSNKRCKWISYTPNEFTLDTLTVLPSSIEAKDLDGEKILLDYDINTKLAKIVSEGSYDSIQVCFTVLPYDLSEKYYKRGLANYDSNFYFREDYGFKNHVELPDKREELFSTPGLQKTGNVSRGISFGNNQSVFVNSTLNMQIEGNLTEDVKLTAVISDQNIPFQPEGNTRQIQEFDRVYVQLQAKNSMLTAGDIVMRNRESHFLRYYKNVQGGQLEFNLKQDSTKHSTSFAGAAVSKGKFASIEIKTEEGVQGPYRLRGPANERFIIVLANSERVYLDGRLLVRGFDYDYIIDYNQAEITFTNNVMITKFSVLRVDFEFSDRNYSRTILNAGHYQKVNKTNLYVNYFTEQDNPRNPLLFEPSQQDIDLLSSIGDSVQLAFISGIDSVGYSDSKILYARAVDELGRTYFVFSTDPDRAHFELSFSEVGPGGGSYEQDLTKTTNGRVYRYVGPGNGNYDPVRNIPTPIKKQMITIGAGQELSEHDQVYGEIAFSQNDVNRFSSLDADNNGGKAIKVGYVTKGRKLSFLKGYELVGNVDFEFNDVNFRFIDRVRDINFERDWSASPEALAPDHIFNSSFGLLKNNKNNLTYRLSRRVKGEEVNGYQHNGTLNKSFGNFQINSTGFLMKNTRLGDQSDWKRAVVNTSYNTKWLVPGVIYSMDKNIINPIGSDSVISSAMYFDEVKFYIRSADTARIKFFADQGFREDRRAFRGELIRDSRARTSNVGLNTFILKNHEIVSNLSYRLLQNEELDGIQRLDDETVLGRFDLNSDLLERHVRSELTITTGTGRELQREFMFIQVAQGEGTHEWLGDLNNNGVQDLDEFVEAVFFDKKEYIKVFVPTDNYVKSYANTFSYRLDITAPRVWRDSKNHFLQFFSRFSNISGWTVNKKILDPSLVSRFSPDIASLNPEDVLSAQKTLRSTIFYNRSNPQYGCDFAFNNSENKQFLSQGFETRTLEEYRFHSRLNIKKHFNVRLLTMKNVRANQSDFLQLRNYIIESYTLKPQFSVQPKTTFRISLEMGYTGKENKMGEVNERLKTYESGVEIRVNMLSKRTINGNFNFIRILEDFKGASFNSPMAFEMLEGLMPGNNITFNVNWQERLSNGLQLSFVYEGRKSESSKMVHIGRMQVSALF